jgi:hypothetical protein
VTDEHGDGWILSWQYQIARSSDKSKIEELGSGLEQLSRSQFNDKLVEVYKEKETLASLGKPVEDALEVLRIKVKAGVLLKGSCVAGQEAEPKLE